MAKFKTVLSKSQDVLHTDSYAKNITYHQKWTSDIQAVL